METMSKEYIFLFNAITDTISELETLKQRLMQYQQTAEEYYITSGKDMQELKHA